MCRSRLTRWDKLRWRWVPETGYYAGQPSVLDDSVICRQRKNWGGLSNMNSVNAPGLYVLRAYLHGAVSLFSKNKIPWLWWNNSSLPFFFFLCLGRKCIIDFWSSHRQCDLEKRALNEKSGHPDSSPNHPFRFPHPHSRGDGAVWPWTRTTPLWASAWY